MSLINQMLKDLDQRGSGTAENERARGSSIRAIPERSGNKRVLAIGTLLLIVLGAASGWYFWQQPVAPPAVPAPPAQLAKVEPALPPAQAAAGESANPASNPALAAQTPSTDKSVMVKQIRTDSSQAGNQALPVATSPSEPTQAGRISKDKPVKSAKGGSSSSPGASEARQTKSTVVHDMAGNSATAEASGKEVTTRQQADNAYGKAISLMGNGQRADAIAELENALAMNPKHAMARQTLASLLLAEKRSDDAMLTLEEGLKLDRTQWGMAMILARLQVEKNDSQTALATLRRSLPNATQKPDYLAFMAALLQREKNHKEAIALYAQALARAPQNGYWWMGYGISLQAENKNADARTAYVNAQKSKNLTPELRAFVEQKLSQLK